MELGGQARPNKLELTPLPCLRALAVEPQPPQQHWKPSALLNWVLLAPKLNFEAIHVTHDQVAVARRYLQLGLFLK